VNTAIDISLGKRELRHLPKVDIFLKDKHLQEHESKVKYLQKYFKGALSGGFRRFLILTVPKSVVGNFTHEKHYF